MNTHCTEHKGSKAYSISLYVLLFLMLTAYSPSSTSLPPSLSNAVSGKVDVGGYELYFCVGEGNPIVIFEAGR